MKYGILLDKCKRLLKVYSKNLIFYTILFRWAYVLRKEKKMLKKVLLTKRNEYFCLGIKTQLKIKWILEIYCIHVW